MASLKIMLRYLGWHYSAAVNNWWHLYHDFVWFFYHFFSIDLITRTMFRPWRRLREPYVTGFDPVGWAGTFILNCIMRIVGILIRLCWLVSSLIFIFALALAGPLILISWLILPLVTTGLWIIGLYLLFA
ncbi:MAG: hypothetical protein AAB468_01815 [Patescibacteria group bacterium]